VKLRNSYFFTLREKVKDEDSESGNLLTRSGMVKKTSAGVYMYLPLGIKVLKNIENIIREEMNNISSEEVLMPALISEEIYEKTGRKELLGTSMFSLKDRFDKPYVLGPTHEELFAIAAKYKVSSYKDLPFSLYQIQNKFRDEARPRYGLIRVREFFMKDAYSFDSTEEGLDRSYTSMYNAYKKIFTRMGINYKIVTADTGVMGGSLSEEFQAVTDIGEDVLVLCDSCDYASNVEVAGCFPSSVSDEKTLEKELVATPDARTIDEVANFLGLEPSKLVKTLVYVADDKPYAILVRGDHEVNETKITKLLKCNKLEMASSELVEKVMGTKIGFLGPINVDIPVIIDNSVKNMVNFVVGANKEGYHYKNVNLNDFEYMLSADIRNVVEGDKCPLCGGTITFKKGIEIGNTFKLGTKYSEKMGLTFVDKDNISKPVIMGSYGIGLGRCMAAIVEQCNDERGIIWPMEVAPYKVAIIAIDINNDKQYEVANHLYRKFKENNIEVLFDDRDERAGVKFKDMDLIGVPIRITVGKKVEDHIVELKLRKEEETREVTIYDVVDEVQNIIEE